MALEAAALALAAALGVSATVDLGLRTEVRGVDGGPPGNRAFDPVPYELVPSVAVTAEIDSHLSLGASFATHVLLLAPEGGGGGVSSSAEYLSGTLSTAWRTERLALGFTAAAGGGRQSVSTLAQLSTTGAAPDGPVQPGQPGQPPPVALDPGAGVRTGRTSTFSGLGGLDWRPSRFLTLGGTLGASRTGQAASSDPAAPAPVFPLRDILSADAYGTVTPDPSDTLVFRSGITQTRTENAGRIAIVTVSTRWEQRHTARTSSSLTAGAAVTVQDTTASLQGEALSRVAPAVAAGIATTVPAGGTGTSASLTVGYAPYVDPFVARVRQRLSGLATLEWQLRTSLRFGASLAAATAFGAARTGPGAVGAELGAISGRDHWEFGLALRAAYQEGDRPTPTVWQYGLVLRVHLRERTTF